MGRGHIVKIRRIHLEQGSFILFFLGLTVAWVTTLHSTRVFIETFRLLSFSLSFLMSGLLVTFFFSAKRLLVMMFFFAVLVYMLGMSILNGVLASSSSSLLRDVLLLTVSIVLFSHYQIESISKVLPIFSYFGLVAFIITICIGGFVLSPVPGFVLEYTGSHYSQGLSKYYGMAAIVAVLSYYEATSIRKRIICFIMVLLFITLSFVGGGRGDFLACMLVIGIYVISKSGVKKSTFLLLSIISVVWFFFEPLKKLEATGRFLVFGVGDFGGRDILLRKSWLLLKENPDCAMIGCGVGYFQDYWGLDSSSYPHNILVELVIAIGFPATLFIVIAICLGLYRISKKYSKHFTSFFLVFSFFLLIELKGGTLMTSWLLLGFSVVIVNYIYDKQRSVRQEYKYLVN